MNPDTRAVLARVVVPNPGGVLKKQMYVRARIQARQESSGLLVHKKMRKKRSSLMMGVKDEEDWEGPVRRRKKKRRVGPNCASPKSKLVEYHQVRGYLLLLF